MANSMEVQIKGLAELQRKLDPKVFDRVMQTGMYGACDKVRTAVQQYPERTAANLPGGPGSHWYVRGVGGHYMTVGGVIRNYGNSEKLGSSWAKPRIQKTSAGWQGSFGNDASYGPFVMGTKQTPWHKRIGWKKVSQIMENEAAAVKRFFEGVIRKAWA